MKIIKFAIFFIVGIIAKAVYCDEPEAIVGGDFAEIKNFKYQVSLQSYGEHICGGSIISNLHIVTAAHCVEDVFYTNGIVVISGTDKIGSGEKHNIKCIRKHPSYTGKKNDGWHDDIAVITLKNPIKFNDVQGPILLASKDHVNGNKRGIISGWGRTEISGSSSPALKWLSVNIVSQKRCLHGHKNPPTNENHICTLEKVGKGACKGDSGGPLVADKELVGVVSWVLPCALGISDVYTNVYRYLDFIKESQSMC